MKLNFYDLENNWGFKTSCLASSCIPRIGETIEVNGKFYNVISLNWQLDEPSDPTLYYNIQRALQNDKNEN